MDSCNHQNPAEAKLSGSLQQMLTGHFMTPQTKTKNINQTTSGQQKQPRPAIKTSTPGNAARGKWTTIGSATGRVPFQPPINIANLKFKNCFDLNIKISESHGEKAQTNLLKKLKSWHQEALLPFDDLVILLWHEEREKSAPPTHTANGISSQLRDSQLAFQD